MLNDTDFLLTKREINRKVVALLSEAEQMLKKDLQQSDFLFPDQTFLKSGKISKGEQYQGLPYWVLDYPRKFSKEATFAYRTIIWWGNDISCFLHLGGKNLEKYRSNILNLEADPNQYVAVHPSPWQYHFGTDNYRKSTEVSGAELQEHMEKYEYHKMIYRFGLEEIEEIPELATNSFRKILRVLR